MNDAEVAGILSWFFRRCEAAQMIGLPMKDVVDGEAIPKGWLLDVYTQYYLPPEFTFTDGTH